MRIPLLDGGGVQSLVDFNPTINRYSLGGQHFGTPDAIPGWSFTRASAKTAPTSSGAVISFASGVPAITDLGFLVELAATNLLLWSQDFTNAAWSTATGVSVSGAVQTAPDGTLTGGKIKEANATATQQLTQGVTMTAASYTGSIYLKAAERTQGFIRFGGTVNQTAVFDLSNGTVVSGTGATIEAASNGWYRCKLTVTGAAASIGFGFGPAVGGAISYAGNGTSGVYAWGADEELGATASSYIVTTTAAVTRAADAATLTYGGSPTTATVYYGTSSTATPSAASPLNLGASSGGAWVGNYVRKVIVQ